MNTQPVAQKAAPKIVKLPIKTEKEKDIKMPPSRIIQQTPKGIVISPGALMPPFVMPPSVRLPPKPPNVDKVTTSPNLGPDPYMDIEENSPHQEGILHSPRSVLLRAATGADQASEHLESGAKVSSITG